MKECPFCLEEVEGSAIECRHCGKRLNTGEAAILSIQRRRERHKAYYEEAKKYLIKTSLALLVLIILVIVGKAILGYYQSSYSRKTRSHCETASVHCDSECTSKTNPNTCYYTCMEAVGCR